MGYKGKLLAFKNVVLKTKSLQTKLKPKLWASAWLANLLYIITAMLSSKSKNTSILEPLFVQQNMESRCILQKLLVYMWKIPGSHIRSAEEVEVRESAKTRN